MDPDNVKDDNPKVPQKSPGKGAAVKVSQSTEPQQSRPRRHKKTQTGQGTPVPRRTRSQQKSDDSYNIGGVPLLTLTPEESKKGTIISHI